MHTTLKFYVSIIAYSQANDATQRRHVPATIQRRRHRQRQELLLSVFIDAGVEDARRRQVANLLQKIITIREFRRRLRRRQRKVGGMRHNTHTTDTTAATTAHVPINGRLFLHGGRWVVEVCMEVMMCQIITVTANAGTTTNSDAAAAAVTAVKWRNDFVIETAPKAKTFNCAVIAMG
ncbi:PREDICTED: uncharacterized protein LOC108977735 [Bactrocera latifrons]|uniref:uncharacterized protein LOC108977735 n=1 Tax=Bactrocera latifrons TaxID=174628 RepID=UPI0008DD7DB3|nr:PREDICTED: uncharacterized protein LOC108977735 [Bactrocera latifrons]